MFDKMPKRNCKLIRESGIVIVAFFSVERKWVSSDFDSRTNVCDSGFINYYCTCHVVHLIWFCSFDLIWYGLMIWFWTVSLSKYVEEFLSLTFFWGCCFFWAWWSFDLNPLLVFNGLCSLSVRHWHCRFTPAPRVLFKIICYRGKNTRPQWWMLLKFYFYQFWSMKLLLINCGNSKDSEYDE